jgi:hypothetical protein
MMGNVIARKSGCINLPLGWGWETDEGRPLMEIGDGGEK